MHYRCTKKDFLHTVETVGTVVPNNHSLPVITCVYITAEKPNKIIIQGTNIETSAETVCAGEVLKEGVSAIPARTLIQTLHTITDEEIIECSTEQGVFSIKSKRGTSNLKMIPHNEYPHTTKPHTETSTTLPTQQYLSAFKSVLFAVSKSLIKPELSGVYIYNQENTLITAATDSFRLAEKKILLKQIKEFPDSIIPQQSATALIRILERNNPNEITLGVDEGTLVVSFGDTYITTRIIDGTFPDYTQIIPKTFTTEATLLTKDFEALIRKASIFADSFGQVTFHIYPQKKTFTTSARSNEVGEVFDSVEAALEGEDVDIYFNYRYLTDVLGSLNSDSVTLSFSGSGKPLVIRAADDRSFMYLVMPMNR